LPSDRTLRHHSGATTVPERFQETSILSVIQMSPSDIGAMGFPDNRNAPDATLLRYHPQKLLQ